MRKLKKKDKKVKKEVEEEEEINLNELLKLSFPESQSSHDLLIFQDLDVSYIYFRYNMPFCHYMHEL